MSPLSRTLPIFLLVFCALSVPPIARAADPDPRSFIAQPDAPDADKEINEGRPIQLTEEMIQKFADDLGIKPNSARMQQILNSYYNPDSDLNLSMNSDLDEQPETPQKVIRHIRGKDGVPFPSKDDVVLPFKITEENVKAGLDKYFQKTEETAANQMKVPGLPACSEDKTTRQETNYPLPDNRDQVLMDILFIRKQDVPLDPKEIFGKHVMVRPYTTDSPNVDSLSALGVGVSCLPTRLRVTRSQIMRDEGKNALRNYENDPNGEGEMHALMKAKLGIQE